MSVVRKVLLRKLFFAGLSEEIEAILNRTKHGFDVAVRSSSPELMEVVSDILNIELKNHPTQFFLVKTILEVFALEAKLTEQGAREFPIILLGNEPLPVGSGFITFFLPSQETLLPSLHNIVAITLEYFQQKNHEIVFDREKMILLREILKKRGVMAVIDAIVLIAFHSGYIGDENVSEQNLSDLLELNNTFSGAESKVSEPSQTGPSTYGEQFFRHLLTLNHHPHDYLKAALSFFVVKYLGHTISEASRMLDISRTTLQEHLRLAEEFHISKYFEPPRESI